MYLMCTAVLIGWDPAASPPPSHPHLGFYTRALLVSKDRRHLFITPWLPYMYCLQKRKPKAAEAEDSSEPVQKRLRPSAAFQGGRPTKFSCSLCDFDTPVRIMIRLLLGYRYSETVNYVPFLIRFSYKKRDRLPNCEFCPVWTIYKHACCAGISTLNRLNFYSNWLRFLL